MWPSAEGIGKDIRENSWLFTRKVADVISEACFIAMMMGDCHYELAVMDLSIIAVTLTPS